MKNLISQGLRLGQKVSKGFRKWLKDKMGKCVNCAKSVMQIFKLTKLTKLTEQIFAESAESAKSSRSIFATYATSASANFVGKESNESTEMYRVKSRIPSCYLRLASVFTSTRIRLVSLICLCMLTIGSGNAWGAGAITVTSSAITLPNGSTTVGKGAWMSATGESQGYWSKDVTVGSYGTITCSNAGDQNSTDYRLQLQANGGYIQTTINSPAGVDITIGLKKGSSGTLTVSLTGATNKTYTSTSWGSLSISTTNTSATLKVTKTGSKAAGISYITITPKAAASCTANPTVGNAANNGALVYSTAPMTVPITCPSIGAGSASCSIKDYGFVWKSGGTPTISDNKTQIGTDNHSTAFSGNISGTFAAGTTYYVKAYAINNGDNTTLSSGTYSFTPRSITFNSNGGSSVPTILVISGQAASQPTDPTKDGYTFGGWYSNEGLTTAVNWSSTIGSNKIYYAKWNDLPKYTVTLMDDGDTRTQASAGASVTLPSRAGCSGYTFAGWTKTWVTAQTSWTTTAPTIINAGSYTPTTNENLYPVYTKTEGGVSEDHDGPSFSRSSSTNTITTGYTLTTNASAAAAYYADQTPNGTNIYVGIYNSSTPIFSSTPSSITITATIGGGSGNKDLGEPILAQLLDNTGSPIGTAATITTHVTNSGGDTYSDISIPTTGITSAYGVRISHIKESGWNARYYSFSLSYTTGGSTTYYISVPNCCTELATINGSVSWSNAATAVVSWDDLAHVSSWTVKYKTHAAGEWSTAGASSASAGIRSVTISSLTPCTNYDFKIIATPDDGYCDKDQTIEDSQTHNWTVTSTITNGTKTSVPTTACGDYTATFAASSGFHFPAKGDITVTGASDFGWNSSTGVLTISGANITGDITISITCPADACSDQFSLHTGNKDQGGWVTNQCFEDADWGAADDAIYVGAFPLTNECYVGWAGGNSYHGTYWAVGGIKTYDIPTGRTLGWNSGNYYESYPGGALGTFHIYKNSTDENYYLRFKPSSYILRTGSDGTSWTSREMTVSATNSHYYETAELDLTSTLISEHAYVDLKTNGGDGHVWCNFSNDRTASGNVKVKSSVGDADGNFRGDNLKASDNGTHGKFRIDVTKDVDNWKLAFVPMYRITYAPGTGASGSMDPSSYAEISTTIAAAAEGFTDPTGKQFNGWSDGVNSYAAGANVTMNSNVTLTAQWTDIDYTVTVSQSPDVSATTTGQTSSAHYNGTINLTTTVPSGYRFVNWTTSDGFSITNSTSATTASFTMPAKNVTVTANFQQTHKVDWYVGGSAPANKIGDDGQTTVVDHGGKISAFPATTPDGSPCDKTFVGWTNTSSYVHGTSPLFNDVAGSPTINADANFYAVFAEVTGGTDYEQVTSLDDIHDGPAYFAYYGSYSGSRWYGVNSVSTITAPVTVSEGVLTTSTGDYTLTEFTIVTVDAANHIYYIKIGDDYVIGSSSGSNTDLSLDDAPYAWTFESINSTTYNMQISHTYTTPSTTCYMKAGVGTATGGKFRSYPTTGQQISLFQTTESVTGHTINCADCGSSVTPTYTAASTGGTVSVTKSAAAVASGSTVKTCTSVDLTVTITPASHYTLTGFTATGLSTGTATISPAVGSTLPVSVAQTFTVTVSAGATGTLTLAPTFTAQTPLSITLETHSKGTFTPIGDIYSGESFTFPTVTPSDAECSSFLGWIEGTTWSGDGTETDPTAITGLANYHAAGSSSGTLTTTKTYTAVFGEKDTQVIPAYQKVTSAPSNWSGDYLIVRDANSRAFDGSLSTLDAADNYIGVTISEGSITANSTVNASKWTIAKVGATSNYTIKSASGYYIGRTANSNGLNSSTSEAYTNTLSYSVDHVVITSSGGPTLQMNSGTRFRYYTTSQQALQLYKYNPDAEVVSYTYTTNPACTPRYRVTISSATGGSPEADKTYEHADETITITANPAAGYSFTSWTITKTTGGDNVTSTLLTGDKPTTANTTFTMPAYDITIAATYTKKMVSTLEVKDGATVVSTTTGPVSGTVNISTGANKTLDVVITPSDAYDHSWTATVSAGSTYASITNVTDDGFRVNGLAQGDATITVNAPNDGSAKSVTLTVQVRDIMPEEIILKRDGSNTPIETLIMYYDETNSKGQYVKVNVGYSPANPTNKAFTFSSALTGKVGSHSHAPASGYEVLVANGVTSDAVNCTFTSSADGSVTKVLAVTVLPILSDRFVDYVHGNATQTVSARLSDDRYSIIPDINTPSLSDASDANPTSEDCETSHYHLVGWLPQTTAEALWAAGTPITDATEGLVRAGESVEATGQTWCAIWAEEQ